MIKQFLLFALTIGLFVLPAHAQEHAGMHDMTTEEAKTVEVANKICPVSGEKIGEMGPAHKVAYQGKIYNLCCKMCAKDFKSDPEKYSKIAEEEVLNNNADEAESEESMPMAEHAGHDGHEAHEH